MKTTSTPDGKHFFVPIHIKADSLSVDIVTQIAKKAAKFWVSLKDCEIHGEKDGITITESHFVLKGFNPETGRERQFKIPLSQLENVVPELAGYNDTWHYQYGRGSAAQMVFSARFKKPTIG